MIPVQLQLKNFMSYGENVPPLRFEGMHVVCFSGANGHGKSALLDAITWALWGRSRARSDDDLIRHGRTEMMVDFEFQLEGLRYRVRRERVKRSKRSQGALEFYVWDAQSGQWRPLTESSMRATQRRIVETLKLDYETFINSAYLKQGQADEFTTRTPGERKRILAEILRLDRYDELEKRAKEKAREVEAEITRLLGSIEHIEEEISREDTYRQELQVAESRLASLEKEREAAEAREREFQTRLTLLKQRQQELQRQKRRIQQLEREMAHLDAERMTIEARLKQKRAYLLRAETIQARYAALQEARQENDRLGILLSKQVRLQQDLQDAQTALNRARVTAEREIARLQQQLSELQIQARKGEEAEKTLAEVTERLAYFAQVETQLEQGRKQLQEIREEGTQTRTRSERMDQDIADLQERIARLQDAQGKPNCPLCGQPLSREHVARLLNELQETLSERQRELVQAQERLKALTMTYRAQEHDIKTLETALRERERWQRLQARAEQQQEQAQQAAQTAERVLKQLRLKEEMLQNGAFAPDLQARVTAVRTRLAALGYDPEMHEQVRKRLAELSGAEEDYRELQTAQDGVRDLETRLQDVQEKRTAWQQTLTEEKQVLITLQTEIAALPDVERAWREQVSKTEALARQERMVRTEVGGLRQQIEAIKQQRKRLKELKQHVETLQEERIIYEELARAFGKNGLQAMIIEAVLPEIEQEANRMLARMTGGRMSVRLKSQRERKTGGTAETLDIEIADDMGVRPYELYSGGEAFRIDFALRVALSKLLARRAGASLRSLFIDEGFGSQDSEGRMRLVDAINAIQEDFELIAVITHIEELKEAFPVRIDVQKGPEGSTYTIS